MNSYLCRICLSQNATELVSLFDDSSTDSLSQKIMFCTNLKLFPVEGLPNKICNLCRDNLEIANEFKLKCFESDAFLRKSFPDNFKSEDSKTITETFSCIPLNVESVFSGEVEIKIKTEKNEDLANEFSYEDAEIALNKVDENIKDEKSIESVGAKVEVVVEDNKQCLKVEENDQKTKKVWVCGECGKKLSKRCVLLKHIKLLHGRERKVQSTITRKTGKGKDVRFHCTMCPFVTKFSQSLIYHERIHTGERPHVCPHCNRTFNQPGNLRCHLKIHSDKMEFKCEVCEKEFKTKAQYKVHSRIHSDNRRLFSCHICDAKLKTKQILDSHIDRHNNVKNFSCETCGARFVTSVELNNHSKIHNKDKCFKCDLCNYRTTLKRSLQSHIKRHSNLKPFKCQSCDLACFTKWELSSHEKTHTRECNYICTMCDRKFIQNSSLNKHMQRTHGVKLQRNYNADRRKVK